MSLRDDIIRDANQAVAAIQVILEHAPKSFVPNPPPACRYIAGSGVKEWLGQLKAPLAPARTALKNVLGLCPTVPTLAGLIDALSQHEATVDGVIKNIGLVNVIFSNACIVGTLTAPDNKRHEIDQLFEGVAPREKYRRREPDTGAIVADRRHESNQLETHVNRTTPVMYEFVQAVERDCKAVQEALVAISDSAPAQPTNPPAREAKPSAPTPRLKASRWRDCFLILGENVTAAVRDGAHRPVSPNPSVRRVLEELLAAGERGTDLENLRQHLRVTAERKRSLLTEARKFLKDTFDVSGNSDPIPKRGAEGGWICLVHLNDGIE